MKQAFSSLFALLAILALSAQSALCQDTAPAPEFEHEAVLRTYDRFIKELEEIEAMLPEDYTVVCPDAKEPFKITLNWARNLRLELLTLQNMVTVFSSLRALGCNDTFCDELYLKYSDDILWLYNSAMSLNENSYALLSSTCINNNEIRKLPLMYINISDVIASFCVEYYNDYLSTITQTPLFHKKWHDGLMPVKHNEEGFERIISEIDSIYLETEQILHDNIDVYNTFELQSHLLSLRTIITSPGELLYMINGNKPSTDESMKILVSSYKASLDLALSEIAVLDKKIIHNILNNPNKTTTDKKLALEFTTTLSKCEESIRDQLAAFQ